MDAFTVNWHKFKPYIFPPFNLIGRISQNIRVDQTTALCVLCTPQVAQSGLVASDEENDDNPTNDNTSIEIQLDVTKQTHRATSIIPKDGFDYLSVVRILCKKWNLSNTTIDLIINSWREGSKSQYTLYFHKWCFYCEERKMHHVQPTSIGAIEFLTSTYLFKQGHSHGQISTARSALSSIISLTNSPDVSFGNLPLVKPSRKAFMRQNQISPNIE